MAELHLYEAHGIGRKEIKRKRYVDQGALLHPAAPPAPERQR